MVKINHFLLPSPQAIVSLSPRTEYIPPCVAVLYISVTPHKYLEGRNDISLIFVSPKAAITVPDAELQLNKCLLT